MVKAKKKSFVEIITRTDKKDTNKHTINEYHDTIPVDEPCVLYLGGNLTTDEHAASGNAKIIEKEILPYVGENVPVYAPIYHFDPNEDYEFSHNNTFSDAGYNFLSPQLVYSFISIDARNMDNRIRRDFLPRVVGADNKILSVDDAKKKLKRIYISMSETKTLLPKFKRDFAEKLKKLGYSATDAADLASYVVIGVKKQSELEFKYIDDLFQQVFLPRISVNGARLPTDTVMRNMRRLNIVGFCHGAYVALKLSDRVCSEMKKLGYPAAEIDKIMAQVLVVAQSPTIPMGVSKFRTIGFMSAHDYIAMKPKNWVKNYMDQKDFEVANGQIPENWMPMMFLSGRGEDLFLINRAFKPLANGAPREEEHTNSNYAPVQEQTLQGQLMGTIAGNVLINGIKNSLAADDKKFVPLPKIEKLILDGRDDAGMLALFDKLKRAGNIFMRDVFKFATENTRMWHKTHRPYVPTKNY